MSEEKILCCKCQAVYNTLSEWEFSCGDVHDWSDWEGDKYMITTSERLHTLENLKEGYPYTYPEYKYPVKGKKYRIKIVDGIYSSDDRNSFYCEEHNVDLKDRTALVNHLSKHEVSARVAVLKFLAESLIEEKARLQGRTMRTADVKKQADEEVEEKAFHDWFKTPGKREALGHFIASKLDKYEEFLSNKSEICPVCQRLYKSIDLEDEESLLGGFNLEKPLDNYFSRISFRGRKYKTDLRKLVHLASHKNIFMSLIRNNLLSGTGVSQLLSNVKELSGKEDLSTERGKKKLLHKFFKETTTGGRTSKDRKTSLTKDEKLWIWLARNRHKDPRDYTQD